MLSSLLLAAWSCLPQDIPLSRDGGVAIHAWRPVIEKSIPNPVLISGHGGSVDGQWVIRSDRLGVLPADWYCLSLRFLYPGREIVLISCNPGAHEPHVHGIWHAHQSVWIIPGKDLRFNRWGDGVVYVGSFGQFHKS